MRNFVASDGPPHNGPASSNPPTNIEKMRYKIGRMADALTRALDALEGDAVTLPKANYLQDQLMRIYKLHSDASALLTILNLEAIRIAAAARLIEPDELHELTRPATDAAAEKGGEA